MTKTENKARWQLVKSELKRVDGSAPTKSKSSPKHQKMARSPFQFLRGSAQLFYADIAAGVISLPDELMDVPNTFIIGDCHFSNFGFFTEEGSHSSTVIWSPNDFDDACEGPATFDLLRFTTSLHLLGDYLEGLKSGRYESEEIEGPITSDTPSKKAISKACEAFIEEWLKGLEQIVAKPELRDEAIEDFSKKHFLAPHLQKARDRTPNGKKFLSKSTVGKLASLDSTGVKFQNPHEKLAQLDVKRAAEVIKAMRPYVDDDILDVVLRLGAGTGSVNVDRFYLLVGPKGPLAEDELQLAHVVEVKQQRDAAMIYHFPEMSPVNTLEAAHLTVDCQRKMMRRPDLILDDMDWEGHHWLIRSRHHARYGVDPEDILEAENPDKAFVQYAKACGAALAIAHARGDLRSTRFEQAMLKALKSSKGALLECAKDYSKQVIIDHKLLCDAL